MFCKKCGAEMNDDQLFCTKCGTKAESSNNTCRSCGSALESDARFCGSCGAPVDEPIKSSPVENALEPDPMFVRAGIQPRSLALAIVLSIVTCGIYSIYWFICLTNEINKLSKTSYETSGGVAFLLNLITCGIYSIYWAYKMGEKRDVLAKEQASSNVIYLVLSFLGLGIVVYCLLQDTINKVLGYEQKY